MDLHEWSMRANNEVRFRVFIDKPGGSLQPLPLPIFGLEAIRYHAGSPCFQYCNKDKQKFKIIRE